MVLINKYDNTNTINTHIIITSHIEQFYYVYTSSHIGHIVCNFHYIATSSHIGINTIMIL